MTAALEGGEWSAASPGRTLPPGKTRYAFYGGLGGPQGRSGRAENLVPTGIRSRTVQPLVSRYTDWANSKQYCNENHEFLNLLFKIFCFVSFVFLKALAAYLILLKVYLFIYLLN